MKTLKIAIALTLSVLFANAQQVVLEEDVAGDTIPQENGQNLKHFTHNYIGIFMPVSETEGKGASINYGKSLGFETGIRYKRKLLNFYSVGYDLNYNFITYNIAQDSGKIFPNTKLHTREVLTINNLELELYNRFSFGKRGNYIKYFVDLGGYGDYAFRTSHSTLDKHKVPNVENARKVKIKNTQLSYTNFYSYGVKARIGYNRYILTARYRLSDLFKSSYAGTFIYYPELPRLSVGLQIGFY